MNISNSRAAKHCAVLCAQNASFRLQRQSEFLCCQAAWYPTVVHRPPPSPFHGRTRPTSMSLETAGITPAALQRILKTRQRVRTTVSKCSTQICGAWFQKPCSLHRAARVAGYTNIGRIRTYMFLQSRRCFANPVIAGLVSFCCGGAKTISRSGKECVGLCRNQQKSL